MSCLAPHLPEPVFNVPVRRGHAPMGMPPANAAAQMVHLMLAGHTPTAHLRADGSRIRVHQFFVGVGLSMERSPPGIVALILAVEMVTPGPMRTLSLTAPILSAVSTARPFACHVHKFMCAFDTAASHS